MDGMGRNTKDRTAGRERRSMRQRRRRNGWRIEHLHVSGIDARPEIVMPEFGDVLAAIERAPAGDDWPAARPLVIPLFPRERPQPPGSPPPLRRLLPPGVVVGFGVDIGPAFMTMTTAQCEILGVSESELVAQSLANLVTRAEQVDPREVFHDEADGMPIAALQTGRSIGSTLILVPDQLRRLFGPAPALFVAPMRDLILGLPADIDPAIAAWWFGAFASQDPNRLHPIAYRFDGVRVVPTVLGHGDTALPGLLA